MADSDEILDTVPLNKLPFHQFSIQCKKHTVYLEIHCEPWYTVLPYSLMAVCFGMTHANVFISSDKCRIRVEMWKRCGIVYYSVRDYNEIKRHGHVHWHNNTLEHNCLLSLMLVLPHSLQRFLLLSQNTANFGTSCAEYDNWFINSLMVMVMAKPFSVVQGRFLLVP